MSFNLTSALSIAIAATIALTSCSSTTAPTAPATPSPESLGVVDAKGQWIIQPLYQEIIYAKKINAFWVKTKQPTGASQPLINFGTANPWKLLDHDGKEMHSELPQGEEPLRQWPPHQALGVSSYDYGIGLLGKDGAGAAEPNGKEIIPCKYHYVQDVGDGYWVTRPGKREGRNTSEKMLPGITLGNVFDLFPPLILFDEHGKQVATLPEGIFTPAGYFKGDQLVCNIMGSMECAVDKKGNVVVHPHPVPITPSSGKAMRYGAPRSFDSFYNWPISGAAPVKLLNLSEKKGLPSEILPIPVAEGLALAPTQDDLVGLINRKGEWVMPPDYNRLAYCDDDRFIGAKGRLSLEQQKQQKLDITAPDIR